MEELMFILGILGGIAAAVTITWGLTEDDVKDPEWWL